MKLLIENYVNWYYLREGDFFPERVGDSKYSHDRTMLQIFIENGSIFPTKEEAAAAGRFIRAFLSAYQKQEKAKVQHQQDASPHEKEDFSMHRNQYRNYSSSTRTHSQRTSVYQQGEAIQGVDSRIVLIKIYHP